MLFLLLFCQQRLLRERLRYKLIHTTLIFTLEKHTVADSNSTNSVINKRVCICAMHQLYVSVYSYVCAFGLANVYTTHECNLLGVYGCVCVRARECDCVCMPIERSGTMDTMPDIRPNGPGLPKENG